MPTGGGAATGAVLVTEFGPPLSGWQTELLARPVVWTVPLAFAVTRNRVSADVGTTMLAAARPGSAFKKL